MSDQIWAGIVTVLIYWIIHLGNKLESMDRKFPGEE